MNFLKKTHHTVNFDSTIYKILHSQTEISSNQAAGHFSRKLREVKPAILESTDSFQRVIWGLKRLNSSRHLQVHFECMVVCVGTFLTGIANVLFVVANPALWKVLLVSAAKCCADGNRVTWRCRHLTNRLLLTQGRRDWETN